MPTVEATNLKDGDRRIVTVLFADLAGFSSLAERLDPEEIDHLMNGLFSRFEAIVKLHEGGVEKYIGDAMVAVFGYPLIHEDDAVRAVNAALDFQDAVESFTARLPGNSKPILRFRIGVHTGLITTGRRGEFEVVTGHAMNVAARVQAEAPVGGILASRATLDECGTDFLCSDALVFSGKNISETIEACRVTGRNRQYLQAERHFVGRSGLIESLIPFYTRHQGQEAGGILLTGDAGVGKTAVVRALVEQIRRLPDFRSPILWARARRFRNRPFALITDLIINHADIDPRRPPEAIQEALASLPNLPPALAGEFSRFLTASVSQPADNSQAFPLLASIIRAISDRSRGSVWSTVIFVDNSHLADRQSLDFLAWFSRNTKPQPFLILAEREPRQDLTTAFSGLHQVEIPPLNAEDSRALLRLVLPDHPLDHDTESLILDNSGGNPLFIHAYARYVRSNPAGHAGIPQTVQNLFLTTISRFNDDIREFLRKMSVFRYNFSLDDALYIQNRTEGDVSIVESALGFFEREEILWQEKGSYFFRHDIFKTALYDSLLNYNKKILHGLVVELMRRQAAPHAVRLVYHLIRSEQFDDAIMVLKKTPEALTDLDFIPLLDALLDSLDPDALDMRRGLSLTKAGLLFNNGLNARADTLLKDLLLQAFTDTDLRCAAGAYHLLTHYNRQSFRFQKADFCGQKALACYDRIPGSQGEQADVLSTLCLNATGQGQEAIARQWLEKLACLPEVQQSGPVTELLTATHIYRALMLGNYREARRRLPGLGPDQLARTGLAWKTDWYQCRLENLEPSLSAWTESCCPAGVEAVHAHCTLAVTRKLLDTPAPVRNLMEQAEFLGLQVQNDFDRTLVCRYLGEAWYNLGEHAKSEAVTLEGLALGERHSTFTPSFSMLCLLVQLYWQAGKKDKARFFMEEAQHIDRLHLLTEPRDRLVYLRHATLMELPGADPALFATLLDRELCELDSPAHEKWLWSLPVYWSLAPSPRSG